VTIAGVDPESSPTSPTHATEGFKWVNNGRVWLYIKNTNVDNDITCTFDTPKTVAGQAVANPTLVVPRADKIRVVGPFPPDVYNDADGMVVATTDGNGTDLEIQAYQF
jgi:hypothetical protein